MDRDRGGGVCGCIVLLLAIFGAYQLYQRYVGDDPACNNWEEWGRAAQERLTGATSRSEQLSPYTSTPRQLEAHAETLRNDAQVLRDSSPPDAARAFTDAAATFLVMSAGWFEAFANGDPPPFLEAELQAQAQKVTEELNALNEQCS